MKLNIRRGPGACGGASTRLMVPTSQVASSQLPSIESLHPPCVIFRGSQTKGSPMNTEEKQLLQTENEGDHKESCVVCSHLANPILMSETGKM